MLAGMVWCLSCGRRNGAWVCRGCFVAMAPGRAQVLESGVRVSSALVHRGAARRLVLRLKYQGCREAAEVLAALMAPLVPSDARALVPIPRIYARRLRFGSDPALLLARALSRRSGLEVCRALGPRMVGAANAGRGRSARKVWFSLRGAPPQGLVVVDDVITTGTTLRTAVQTLGGARIRAAVTATASP